MRKKGQHLMDFSHIYVNQKTFLTTSVQLVGNNRS